VSKKIIFTITILFGAVILGLVVIYTVGLLGEPKSPKGISTEQDCRDNNGIVLEGEQTLCQLPDFDPFEVEN